MSQGLLELKGVARTFGVGEAQTKALRDATFSIKKGEFVSIMGPSGSGKSTLLHIMGLLDRPTGGEYILAGHNTVGLTDAKLAQLRNENIGFVFQSFFLLGRSTVLENVVLPLYYSGVPQSKWREMAVAALNQVDLSHRLDHEPSQLSGGEKQRVAIARALVNSPDIIFADEPTGNLDSVSGQAVMSMIRSLNEAGHTVVLITHERTAAAFAERLITLRDGVVESDKAITDRNKVFSK